MKERRWGTKMRILKLILLYNVVFILSFEKKSNDPFGITVGPNNFNAQLGATGAASNAPAAAPAAAAPATPAAAGGGGDCRSNHQAAGQSCDPEHVQRITATLAGIQAEIDSLSGAGQGVGATASGSLSSLTTQKAQLEAIIADCQGKINSCKDICTNEYITALNQQNHTAANQAHNNRTECERRFQETANAARQTSMDMGKAMEALMALMQMLGMNTDSPQQAEAPLCTREPNNPSCKTDTASVTTGGDFTTGSFRGDTSDRSSDGDLGTEADPEMGKPAAQASSGGGAMGSAGMPLGGGGGGVPSGMSKASGDKKSEFDGTPKINMASGFANAGGGGAPGGGGRGGAGSKGGTNNPYASRTSIDGDQQAASKIAQAAEERLRNPANANEPIGGITSVYYLDNFTKVEKRMTNERNTLQEH